MVLRSVSLLAASVIVLAACSQEEPSYTQDQRACIAQRFPGYNARQLNQCIEVCRACFNGTPTTCNTSCKLKGAS